MANNNQDEPVIDLGDFEVEKVVGERFGLNNVVSIVLRELISTRLFKKNYLLL